MVHVYRHELNNSQILTKETSIDDVRYYGRQGGSKIDTKMGRFRVGQGRSKMAKKFRTTLQNGRSQINFL
jgi:hypothetical protein